MNELAELVGLSRTTVSDVIHDRWRQKGISQKTYDRVMEAVRKSNFRPNSVARSLVSGKTRTLGVHLPTFLYDHWTSVIQHLDMAARTRGYHLLLSMPGTWQEEQEEIRRLCDQRVDGLILSPSFIRRIKPLAEWIQSEQIPFVFLGNTLGPGYYSVIDDGRSQAKLAVEHLIRLGHRRIAYIHGSSSSFGETERRRGYLQTLAQHGIALNRQYVRVAHYDVNEAKRAIQQMLRLPQPPTAVYCAGDTMALGAIAGAHALGVNVPTELAVVGHGDEVPFSEFQKVPLTSVRQSRQHLAELAVWMTLDLIDGRMPVQSQIRLPGELIVRASCGAVINQ